MAADADLIYASPAAINAQKWGYYEKNYFFEQIAAYRSVDDADMVISRLQGGVCGSRKN